MVKLIEYSRGWYEKEYHLNSPWMNSTYPIKLYEAQSGYENRLYHWMKDVSLMNKKEMLEVSFNDGKTAFWMKKMFPHLIIDMFEFSQPCIDWIRNFPDVSSLFRDIFWSDVRNIQKPNNSYDLVMCLDVVEHLPDDIYCEMRKELYRVLRKNGYLFIYIGEIEQQEHINLKPNLYVVKREFCDDGFKFDGENNRLLKFCK